jgi:GNAT superfamily N-acetyltransferase
MWSSPSAEEKSVIPEFEIRTIQPSDAVPVSHLISQIGQEQSPLAICEWVESLHRERRHQAAFVLAVRNQIVGLVEIGVEHHLQRRPFALIRTLVIDRHFRNNGFRRLLCAHAEDWAWKHGAQTVRANPQRSNFESHHFYRENGFQAIRETVVFEKLRSR